MAHVVNAIKVECTNYVCSQWIFPYHVVTNCIQIVLVLMSQSAKILVKGGVPIASVLTLVPMLVCHVSNLVSGSANTIHVLRGVERIVISLLVTSIVLNCFSVVIIVLECVENDVPTFVRYATKRNSRNCSSQNTKKETSICSWTVDICLK